MKSRRPLSVRPNKWFVGTASIACLALSLADPSVVLAQQADPAVMTTTTTTDESPKMAPEELESLVAPIALYPDPLLAQTLAASTYPIEVIQLQQWMDKNKNLTGKALAEAVAKQPWDPSVQGLVQTPDVVQRMAGNIQWTSDLGNAFLAQQSDVMAAVQRLRAKAQGTGNLKTSEQSVVQTETVPSGQQVIKIEQANPEVVYVPSYDSTVVYGAAPAAYPYYPYTYPGYVPGTALMWGAGIALGAAAWGAWGGHWGNCDWNGGNVNINNNYNYNKNVNRNNVNRGQGGQGNWQHNPSHRGNAPYGDRGTANKFGGRGPGGAGGAGRPGGVGGAGGVGGIGGAGRPGGPGGAGGIGGAGRPGGAGGIGGAGKPGGPGGAGGIGGAGKPGGPGGAGGIGGAGKPGGAGGAGRPGGAGGAGKPGGAGGVGSRPGGGSNARPGGGGGSRPSTMPANRGGGGSNSIGGRSPSRGGGGSGFSGGGMGGHSARQASSRGGRSMGGGGRGGGGVRGGGGGRRR